MKNLHIARRILNFAFPVEREYTPDALPGECLSRASNFSGRMNCAPGMLI
jgi:hypothetical protein